MYEQQTNATTPQPKLQQPKQPKTVSIEEWEDIVADKYQIPKGLWKAIPSQESGGKGWDAVSGTGVRGKYQVTEKTARAYGLDRNDPYQQVVAAARTLRDAYDSEKNESDEQKRWLRATGRYYFGDGAVDATGAISAKSRDGVSNPGAHLEKIAKYWGDYERQQKPQTVAEPVSAQPSPTPDPKAKTYYHPPDGEHRGFWTNYPLEPIVRTKEEEEAQAKVGQPHIWSGDETDDQGALTGRGMVIHKPEGVAMKESPAITKRDRDAARLIRNIESQRKRALDLFKQADDFDRRAAAGNAEQNRQSAKTLREQADAELYKANLMATSAQERFGDIVEAGFGKDADPNSKRQWAYAKAKTPDMREKIDRIDLRQGEIGRREAAEKMQVTPEQKVRFEKQREVERLRKEFEGQYLPARLAQRWLTAASGGLNPDEQVITQPVNTAEEVVNRLGRGAARAATAIPEGFERLAEAMPTITPDLFGTQARIQREKAAAAARGEDTRPLTAMLTDASKTASDRLLPVDPNNQSFWTAKLPEGLGSSVPFIASSVLGGGMPAAAAIGSAMNAQQVGEELDKLGVKDEATRQKATAVAGLIGSLEALGIEGKLGKVFGGRGGLVKRLMGAGSEGVQEWTTEELNDINAKLISAYDPKRSIDPLQRKQLEAAALGALTGGLFEAGGKVAEVARDRQAVRQTAAERPATPTDIQPTTIGPTQITPLDPRAAKSIPRETTLPLAAPEVAAPVAEVAAQIGVQPEEAQQVVNQAVAEVEAETGQVPPEAFPLLPESEKAARMRQRAARSGMRDALPFEVRLNDDLNTAATLLQSPDAADQMEGQRILNIALREIQQSPGYLGEVQAQRSGQKVEATPYSATKAAIQSRLKGIEDTANRAKETEKSQKEAGQRAEKLERYAATAVQRGVIPPVDAIQRSFRMTPDEATAFQASIAGQIEGRTSQTGALPQAAQTGQIPQGRPTDALPTAALPKSAKVVARAPFGEGYQPAIEQFTQGAQMASRSVEAGRFADARDAYKRQIEALKIARANINRRTAEGAKEYGRLGTRIAGIERQIGDLRQAQREAAKQANAPTAGLARPVTFSEARTPQSQGKQRVAGGISGDISAPLLQPEAVQNPQGGIPQMPEQTFSGRLQRGIERQQVEVAQGDTENLTIAGMLKRRFPEGIRIADRGEARNLGGREGNALVGLVNRNSRVGVDDVAYALHEEGLRLPDGRPFVEDGRVVASESDVLGFIRSNGKQKVGGTKSLAKNLAEQEAEYDKQRRMESEVVPTGELKTDASLEADEDAEAMASLQRAIERSETENPRPYAERTRPAEPGSSGVSFSPYADMVANNKEKVDRLYQMNLTTPRAQAVINELRAYSIKNGIELRHLHALLDDVANTQIRDAGWRDRGVSPEAFALAEREKTLQYLGEQQAQTDRQLKRAIANAPLNQRERLELEVAAIDELATILRDDPDMMALFDDAVTGVQSNVEDFVNAAGQAYGIAEDIARSLVDGQRQDYQTRQSNQRRAVPAQRKAATAQATARPKRGEFTAADEDLLNQNPAIVSDADFDAYLKRLEEIRNLNIYGEMFGGVDLLPSLARKVRVRIAQANEERHIRVMDKKLGAKHEKRYVPTLEERQEVFDLLERTIDEPQADRDRKVADLRKAQEARRNAKTTESVTPATTDRAIQHSQFGEVRVAADQSGVSKGKLRVIDGDGKSHEIQNPRTSGNRDAAFVKTQPKMANEGAQSEVRQPAAKAGNSLEESRRLATEYHDRFSKAQTASEMQAVIESGRELTRQFAESQSQAKTPSEKRAWDRLIANVRDFDERYIETYNEVRAEESRQAGKERQEAEAKASREQIAKDFPDTTEPGVSHYIYARNKKGQKVQVGGPYESAAAAYADRNRVKDELPPRIARDFVGFSYGKRADAPAPPAKSIDAQIKDIRDLVGWTIDQKEADRQIAELEARRPKIAEQREVQPKTREDVENSPEFKRWFGGSRVVDKNGKPLVVYHGTQSPSEISEFNYSKLDPNALYGPGFYTTQDPNVAAGEDGGYAMNKGNNQENAHAYKLYLRIKNPLDINDYYLPGKFPTKLKSILPDEARIMSGQDIYEALTEKYGSKAEANILLQLAGFDGITHLGGMNNDRFAPRFKTFEDAKKAEGKRGGRAVALVPGDKFDESLPKDIPQILDDDVDSIEYIVSGHRVWIAFYPEQIKSATGNRGTFDSSSPRIAEQRELANATKETPFADRRELEAFSPPITPDMDADDVVAGVRAKLKRSQGRSTLYINEQARRILRAIQASRGYEASDMRALSVEPSEAQDIADFVRNDFRDEAPTQRDAMYQLARQLDAAARTGQRVNLIAPFGRTLDWIKHSVRHEGFHQAQGRTNRTLSELLPGNWLASHKYGKQIIDTLNRSYTETESGDIEEHPYDLAEHNFEAPAFIASGNYSAFGLSENQAVEFLSDYFDAIAEYNGADALINFARLHPAMQKARIRSEQNIRQAETERGRGRGQLRNTETAIEQPTGREQGVPERRQRGAESVFADQTAEGRAAGRDIRERIESLPAFKAWFGDSKVVGTNGRPLPVYHGTQSTREISEIDLTKSASDSHFGAGFYLTDSPEIAAGERGYAMGGNHPRGRIESGAPSAYKLYAKIENPLYIEKAADTQLVRAVFGQANVNFREMGFGANPTNGQMYDQLVKIKGDSKAEANKVLQRLGYDGITRLNPATQNSPEHREWMVFRPTQVKSATGNRGTFEPENPRIAEQRPINHFSVGRVPEGRGAVLASGLNIQGLFDRKPKPDQPAPAKSKATVPLPKDFNATAWGEKFYRDAMAAALSRTDRAEYDAAKTVREKNAVLLGADVDEKYEDKIYDLVDRVNDAVDKGDGAALRKVIQEASRMTREKRGSIRKNVFETIGAGQAAVQLATPGFVGRNILQHASSAIQSGISDRLASAIDAAFSAATKTPRAIKETGNPVSQTLEGLRNYKKGLKEGWEKHKAGADLGSGKLIDLEDLPTNKIANGFRELLFFINDLPDAGNYVARYERALKSLVKADERNKTPMTETRMAALTEQAKLEADHASLRDDNFISHALKHLKTTLNHITSPVTGTDKFGLGDFIVKYTQVPGALVKRSIEYSPLGLIEAGWRAQRAVRGIGSDFERRSAIQALSRAITGTGSTLGMGAALFLTGILVPPEKDDYTSEQLERARGVRGFSVNLSALARLAPTLLNGEGFSAAMKVRDGDKLIPIDWVQPWAMGASVGATLAKDWKEGKLSSGSATKASFRSLSNALEIMGDQSVLKNVREYLRAAKGKTFTEIAGNVTEKFVKSAPQSFAPGITRQIGGVIDPGVRDYRPESRKGITNALKEGLTRTATGTLPGLSLRYPEKLDPITGKPMKTAQGERTVAQRILSLFSPQAINEYKADSLRDEIIRLNDYLEEKDISLYVPPLSSQQTRIKGYEEPTRLLRQRETEFAKEFAIRGRRLVESPRFAMLSDDKKADALRDLISDIRQKTYKSGTKTETLKPQYKQPAIRP